MYTLWMTKGGEKSREFVWNRYIGVVGVLHATGDLQHNISVYNYIIVYLMWTPCRQSGSSRHRIAAEKLSQQNFSHQWF